MPTHSWGSGFVSLLLACGAGDGGGDGGTVGDSSSGPPTSGSPTTAGPTGGSATTDMTTAQPTTTSASTTAADSTSGSSTGMPVMCGEDVDLSDPQLYEFQFSASDADPMAMFRLETQLAALDTRVPPLGRLVVYLHGAGNPGTCGSTAHGEVLAGMGFHVFSPCYESDYGVGNCGADIGGCRLEAFEGVDHHDEIDFAPPRTIETRVVRGLEYLQAQNPEGNWECFIDGGLPRWDQIVISGISHGASTSSVVGMNRVVDRVVSLSGPLDMGQAWLLGVPMTPIDRFFGFTHTGDTMQHSGHLQAFEDLGLPGAPTVVDGMDPPYGDSHRMVSSAMTGNGHNATQAGGSSPMTGDQWVYEPVWRYMYGAPPAP